MIDYNVTIRHRFLQWVKRILQSLMDVDNDLDDIPLCLPMTGMSWYDHQRYYLTPTGTTVATVPGGCVRVDRQVSEIPDAHRLIAPNFAPTDMVLGFIGQRDDHSSPMAPYHSANKLTARPALFPSIKLASEALSGPRGVLYPRLAYHTDVAPSDLDAYLASVSTAPQRDNVKDGI